MRLATLVAVRRRQGTLSGALFRPPAARKVELDNPNVRRGDGGGLRRSLLAQSYFREGESRSEATSIKSIKSIKSIPSFLY